MALNSIAAREAVAAEMLARRDLAAGTTLVTSSDVAQGARAVGMLVLRQAANAATPISLARLVTNIPSAKKPNARKSSCPKRARIRKQERRFGVPLTINVVEVHAWQKMDAVATTKTMMVLLAPRTTFAAAMSARPRKVNAARIRGIRMLRGFH